MIYLLIFIAFFADRVSKWWAAAYLVQKGPEQINPYFTLVETYNRGIAFGMFQGIGPLVGWLTILVVIGLLIFLHRLPRNQWLNRIGIALIIGGALGNQIDRILFGQVLDFIKTPFRSGVFNVADLMIQLGILLLIVGLFVHKSVVNEAKVTQEYSGK